MFAASLSENTKAVYTNALRMFQEFRCSYGFGRKWPVSVSHVASYVSYCFQMGYSPATVSTYLSALGFIHKLKNLPDPTESFIIKKIIEGFKRLNSRKDVRAPITKDILIKICQALPFVCYSHYEFVMFKACFCLAYFGLFRIGELVYTDQRQAGYALRLDDIKFGKNTLTVRIRMSKTNQLGKPVFLNLSAANNTNICPVKAVYNYIQLRSARQGNLFCHTDGSFVTRYQFCAVLSKSISYLRLPVGCYRSHSFRIGRATALAMSGVPSKQIKAMGRWQSNVYSKYVRPYAT